MKSCNVQRIKLDCPLDKARTLMTLIDYRDDTWGIRLGKYAFLAQAKVTTQNVEEIVAVLSAMLIENEQEMAAESGDYETEPKMDELNTEAWLDMEAG